MGDTYRVTVELDGRTTEAVIDGMSSVREFLAPWKKDDVFLGNWRGGVLSRCVAGRWTDVGRIVVREDSR